MPGLKTADDRTFVVAFQSLDRGIINPWFMLGAFFGSLVLAGAAVLKNLGRPGAPWIIAAFLLILSDVVVTIAIHLPLNNAIKAAGVPDGIQDLAQVRRQFNEARWATWNRVRTATATAAFVSLAWSLILYGQATA
ncbi:DUF1772 domain-containing protein [Cryobacterium sp. MDB1-18-2]|uniref:DUF1772 domain-containing protein n=2 Tax=Microbacteriaceae TaxID=85023 RepID=A0ABY2IR91_9MICO|nr:DUF1772 domain-containing protein [Cryobacterium sp. MDB2-A-1]TFC04297.1 DUF1772 domain-containing protein [Cryobacterium sp. MDB2-33-2]TFC14987.1 DUF1772 domain-containing protein [Cryobacterium sp. MDB2-A-2]TFC16469.1 DUF1772 domain-containing protein [Cryobacterium sp. MDB2-10]TFC21197.1 DUF1772 domain-containing protein [Cryobacterium glucosi]TFC22892.1 DUF1772 domain-containing protein [Cryobacterium sp. MDB1-18-2]TFC42748.1 DUF1772 domain-containing protein [Cryobacterium sp. MDB1-18